MKAVSKGHGLKQYIPTDKDAQGQIFVRTCVGSRPVGVFVRSHGDICISYSNAFCYL